MVDQISPNALRALDDAGDPAGGAKLYVYETGTTTPVTVYTDTALSVAHAAPIVADSDGYFAQIFYGGSTQLKIVLTDSADVTLETIDPAMQIGVTGGTASSIALTPFTGVSSTNVQDAFEEEIVTSRIADSAITTAKIADDAVTRAKLATPPAMEFIESQDASSDATLDFTGFDASKYDSYVFKLSNIIPSDDDKALGVRTSTDGGSSYDSSAGNYQYALQAITAGAGGTGTATASSSATVLFVTSLGMGNGATEDGVSGTVEVHGPHLAKETMVTVNTSGIDGASGNFTNSHGGGVRLSSADVDAVQFLFATGSIASGTITMYGLRNS